MPFGEVTAPDSATAAEWLGPELTGREWTVGSLVPERYPRVLRVWAPEPTEDDGWWTRYQHLFEVLAAVGVRHTSSPERAWFGIWDGHGFDTVATLVAHLGPLDDDERRALDGERARLRAEDRRRNAEIRSALAAMPRFERPHRAYYLLEGSVAAVSTLRYPGVDGWRNPDLFWPDDRRWLVATDVDFWSLYVGGDGDFLDELAREVPTRAAEVPRDAPLESEN